MGWNAAVEQRQLDVLQGRVTVEEVIPLEHEPLVMAPQQGALVAGELADFHALELIGSRSRCIEAPEYVHARRFARSAGPHYGDEFSLIYLQIDATERLHLCGSLAVDLGHLSERDKVPHLPPATTSTTTFMPGDTSPARISVTPPFVDPVTTGMGTSSSDFITQTRCRLLLSAAGFGPVFRRKRGVRKEAARSGRPTASLPLRSGQAG